MIYLQLPQVKKAVYSWSIRFSERAYDNNQLLLLSREYLEDLVDLDVSEPQFEFAIKRVRQRCRFFPKVADIMDAVNEYRTNPPVSDSLQIAATSSEHDQTPEEKELSGKIQAIAMRAIRKEITFKESVSLQEQLIAAKKTFTGRLKAKGSQNGKAKKEKQD